jgi:predicted transposase
MKLTLKIKLLPTNEQADLILETMKEANTVCNAISDVAWRSVFSIILKLHHQVYHSYKATFNLSSQILVRCIAKVADAYKLDKKTKREFRPLGSIGYDSRIMTYKPNNVVSLWCIGGRQKIDFVCHNPDYLLISKAKLIWFTRKVSFTFFKPLTFPKKILRM